MKYIIDDKEYNVIIKRKNNKNTYIRIDEFLNIVITTNYLMTNSMIKRLLEKNNDYIVNMISETCKRNERNDFFYLFGKKYDIIIMPGDTYIYGDYIYVESMDKLNKWYKEEAKKIFKEHLDFEYSRFTENIPYPKLKIRKMKTRWGVNNRRDNSVTLNIDLMKYDVKALDYIIIHELSHFIEPNHSKKFWLVVEKYMSDYKKVRKMLKE